MKNFYKIHIKSHMGGQKLVLLYEIDSRIYLLRHSVYFLRSIRFPEASEVSSNIFMIHISQKVGQKRCILKVVNSIELLFFWIFGKQNRPRFCGFPGCLEFVSLFAISGVFMPQQKSASANTLVFIHKMRNDSILNKKRLKNFENLEIF